MKKKNYILSFCFAVIVFFAIVLQAAHSFLHLEIFISEQHCRHKYNLNETEIGHSHDDFDRCFACEFTFSSSLELDTVVYPLVYNSFYFKPSFLKASESILFYSGSSFSLRGPPIV